MWSVYILECGDGSYYTGMTSNINFRLKYHNEGKASKYTRNRRPVKLKYIEECGSRAVAMRRERQIKKLNTHYKKRLIDSV